MKYFVLTLLCISYFTTSAQTFGYRDRAITTALPFLRISPDARSGGLGDAGVAVSPDVNAVYWNPSKLAFMGDTTAVSLSYSPWMRNLTPDMNLGYLSFVHTLGERNAIGGSLHYFNMGDVDQYDEELNSLGVFSPNEYSFVGSFARKFGNFSLGLSLRYLHSNLTTGADIEDAGQRAVNAVSTDISLFHQKNVQQFGKDAVFAFGAMISNIGPKVDYSDNGKKYFLPTNLKIGVANTWILDGRNQITLALDVNKLLVPTPPVRDEDGRITRGMEDDRSVLSGIFGSVADAPYGFKEEMQEVSYSPAMEYWYNKQFALRLGYLYEDPAKGNRQYATFGAGVRYRMFNFDFSHVFADYRKNHLGNSMRFSLSCNLRTNN